MNNEFDRHRRQFMVGAGILAGAALWPAHASAQTAKLRLGLMLPYTGTYAQLGIAIENGLKLALEQAGGKLGGREVEIFKGDGESEPSKATDHTKPVITRDKVDVLIGSVHSGVAMGMLKVAKESGTLMLIPNAGAAAATGGLCTPNGFA